LQILHSEEKKIIELTKKKEKKARENFVSVMCHVYVSLDMLIMQLVKKKAYSG
jgi:hypothetical protein